MKSNLGLNLIYRSHKRATGETFQVLYFFSEAGFITEKILLDSSKALFPQMDGSLEFQSLEDLGRFSLQVCQELRSPEVFVLSSEDYNQAVEATRDIRNFRDIYRRFGHSILNPEFKKDKQGFFGKFFKE